jgi:hypothetical protein
MEGRGGTERAAQPQQPIMALRPLLRAQLPPSEESHGDAYEADKGVKQNETTQNKATRHKT